VLVAVDESMVLHPALAERGGFLDQVGVMTGLRPVEAGCQQAWISNATGFSPFRSSRYPISAGVPVYTASALQSRSLVGRCHLRMRFSAAKYSCRRNNS
jgi:hypothetical protein